MCIRDRRDEIMHINETNDIKSLIEALNYFHLQTKNDITLEYVLLKGTNDTIEDAKELAEIYKRIPTHLINVIEYNPVAGINFKRADEDTTETFTKYLLDRKVNVRIRRSRGKDIDAACGQLANK